MISRFLRLEKRGPGRGFRGGPVKGRGDGGVPRPGGEGRGRGGVNETFLGVKFLSSRHGEKKISPLLLL